MREIRFRAWDKHNKRFVNQLDLINPEVMTIRITEQGFRFLNENESWNMFEQYTGLKDKNDKEVYEGDIISDSGKILGEVIFDGGSFCIYDLNTRKPELLESYDHEPEIIGNIHENPELGFI
jgi:uncharacterized phage protein (TIGR01671 family)